MMRYAKIFENFKTASKPKNVSKNIAIAKQGYAFGRFIPYFKIYFLKTASVLNTKLWIY